MNNLSPRCVYLSFLLAVTVSGPARATPPPEPPPCIPVRPAVTVEALGNVIASNADHHVRECAAEDLASRGVPAVTVAIKMLGSSDTSTLVHALKVIGKLGPQAHAAVPTLMGQLKALPFALQGGNVRFVLYDAVSAIGKAAVPAIPLLIIKSRDPDDSYYAVGALGKLGRHDARRVVPHLISLLNRKARTLRPLDVQSALDALHDIGKAARSAVPATLAALENAKAAGAHMDGMAAIRTLAVIGEPGESVPILIKLLGHPMFAMDAVNALGVMGPPAAGAVPALIKKLNGSRHVPNMSENVVSALAEIAPRSPLVQRQLLVEATQHQDASAAYALAHIGPLPASFAPALTAALAKKRGDYALGKALKNTRSPK